MPRKCDIPECPRAAVLHPVLHVHAAGVPSTLYGAAHVLLEDMAVCATCAQAIDRRDFNTDIGWQAILRVFEVSRQRAPDRDSLALTWCRVGSEEARLLFDASDYAPPPYQGWPARAIEPPRRGARA